MNKYTDFSRSKWFRIPLSATGYSLLAFYGNWPIAIGVFLLIWNLNIGLFMMFDYLTEGSPHVR